MKKLLTALLLNIVFQLFVSQPFAEMYKWVDKNGVLHFSDTPPVSEQNVETIETSSYPEESSDSVSSNSKNKSDKKAAAKSNRRAISSNKVELYMTSWCRYCKDAVNFLRSNRIRFKQYDIDKDKKAAAKMKRLGGSGGVPFAVINGQKIQGWSVQRYKRALGMN